MGGPRKFRPVTIFERLGYPDCGGRPDLVGRCGECDMPPSQLVFSVGGWEGALEVEVKDRAIDFREVVDDLEMLLAAGACVPFYDEFAICDECGTYWEVGHMIEHPPPDDCKLVEHVEGREIIPVAVARHSWAAWRARSHHTREDSVVPDEEDGP